MCARLMMVAPPIVPAPPALPITIPSPAVVGALCLRMCRIVWWHLCEMFLTLMINLALMPKKFAWGWCFIMKMCLFMKGRHGICIGERILLFAFIRAVGIILAPQGLGIFIFNRPIVFLPVHGIIRNLRQPTARGWLGRRLANGMICWMSMMCLCGQRILIWCRWLTFVKVGIEPSMLQPMKRLVLTPMFWCHTICMNGIAWKGGGIQIPPIHPVRGLTSIKIRPCIRLLWLWITTKNLWLTPLRWHRLMGVRHWWRAWHGACGCYRLVGFSIGSSESLNPHRVSQMHGAMPLGIVVMHLPMMRTVTQPKF